MGLNLCDTLEKVKKADIIMFDMKDPCMQPINNIISNIVYSGNKSIVNMTMINGKVLYQNGKYMTLNPSKCNCNCCKFFIKMVSI